MNREQALEILHEFTKSENLRKHALAVEACVTAYARKFGDGPGAVVRHRAAARFRLGDSSPACRTTPSRASAILAERGVSEEIRRAILSHADFTGVPRESPLEKTLFACDELAGFITAVSYVKPHRSVFEVDAPSVRKKMKDKAFARSVNRQDILDGARELGVELDEHIDFCVKAMQERADALGLKGSH